MYETKTVTDNSITFIKIKNYRIRLDLITNYYERGNDVVIEYNGGDRDYSQEIKYCTLDEVDSAISSCNDKE
jgi:hypothetical protein